MQIVKGNDDYLQDCIEALQRSDLGQYYFSREGSAEEAVKEGLEAGTLFVAIDNNEFKGFMYYIPKGAFHAFPYLHLIVTKASERGNGIGTKMLAYLESMVNSSKIFLVVADFNPKGKEFYEKNGYIQIGRIEGLYREGIAENIMMKEVANLTENA